MGRSVSLAAYMLLSRYGEGWFARKLDANTERRGIASAPRPEGPLIWINVNSVSGADAIMTLCRRLLGQNPLLNCLITTQTEAAAQSLQGQMPSRMTHQYIPVDAVPYITAFLDHWEPHLSVWTETEFQPAFVVQAKRRNIPTVYIDASMSAKSFRQYRLFNGMTTSLLQRFDQILTQDAPSKKHLQHLGAPVGKIETSGRLDGGTFPLPHDETQRKALARAIGGRAVWLAALTHEDEEEAILAAHKIARRSYPELLLILAPRQPERGDSIADRLRAQECTVAQRSKSQQIDRLTDVYLADTADEIGLWYRLAPVSFIGGSLSDQGGQNPLFAAALGSAILHGSQVSNFATAYKTLLDADACIPVTDGPDLAKNLERALAPERAAQLATAAWGAYGEGDSANDRVYDLLQSYFPKEAT
ncbi:MAG: 3-deoxy-D-manno-octulosonic acid transferase [Alphaproteobacteria bacterium]